MGKCKNCGELSERCTDKIEAPCVNYEIPTNLSECVGETGCKDLKSVITDLYTRLCDIENTESNCCPQEIYTIESICIVEAEEPICVTMTNEEEERYCLTTEQRNILLYNQQAKMRISITSNKAISTPIFIDLALINPSLGKASLNAPYFSTINTTTTYTLEYILAGLEPEIGDMFQVRVIDTLGNYSNIISKTITGGDICPQQD